MRTEGPQSLLSSRVHGLVWQVVYTNVNYVVPARLERSVWRGAYRNDGFVVSEAVCNHTIRNPHEPRHPALDKFLMGCAG